MMIITNDVDAEEREGEKAYHVKHRQAKTRKSRIFRRSVKVNYPYRICKYDMRLLEIVYRV